MKIYNTVNLKANTKLTPNHKSWIYNGLDCCVTLEVQQRLRADLALEPDNVKETYHTAMRKLAPVGYMCMKGLKIDFAALSRSAAAYRKDLRKLNRDFDRICEEVLGYTVNWRSPLQLKTLFYTTFALKPIRKRNAQGFFAPTTNADALERLCVYRYPQVFARYILAMRVLGKKISFLETPGDKDGRMRTSLNIAGTDTGRFASQFSAFGTGSNLQNVEDRLRRVFVADPGHIMVNVDLEQADARNVAARIWQIYYKSHGPEKAGAYLDACESGDLHTTVCSMAWGELDWPDPWDPKKARAVADGKAYRELSYRDMAKKLGHGCLTATHEVLTPKGWVPISDQPNVILQWGPETSTWTSPSHWEAKSYTGELQIFEGNSINAVMTHDHRVPYKKDGYSSVLHEAPAEDGPQKFMPLGSGYVGGTVSAPGRLIAAVMSDGSIIGNRTRFNLRKKRKIARLKKLCEEAGVEHKTYADGTFSIGYTCRKKAGPWLLELDAATALALLDEYKYWDGHRGKTSTSLMSIDANHLNWLQTLGRLYGIGGNLNGPQISGYGSIVWTLQQNNRLWASGASIKHTVKAVSGEMVYCPTVETGWFYVRHRGHIFVTGNTNYYGLPRTMAMHTKTEASIIENFQARYFRAFPLIGNIQKDLSRDDWHGWVYQQLKHAGYLNNLFGRRRLFFDRYKDPRTLRAAIAYDPQSTTGEELDRGWLQLWDQMPEALLQLPVHDSILFQLPFEGLHETLPRAMEILKVTKELEGGRLFTVPLEASVGWNWGKSYRDKKTGIWDNPYGQRTWDGTESRTPPKNKTRLKHYLS